MADRLSRLRDLVRAADLDALLVTCPENRRYMSGFTGSAGILIVSADRAALVTDFRYFEQVARQSPQWRLVPVVTTATAALAEEVDRMDVRRVGFEAQHVTVDTLTQWHEALPSVELTATKGLVEGIRMVKDAEELRRIEEAVRIADDAMLHIYDWIRPGVTERDIAWELEVHMRTHGAEALAFTTIVGSGPNGAMSHAVTSDRPVAPGDPIVIDMGARVDGYCSDLTRSFCLRSASTEYLTVWNTVLGAQQAAEEALRPGLTGIEADATARRLIYDAGYEGKFGHGLGHGVGLAIHEDPSASMRSEHTLAAGHVLTIEPGIYVPGWCGVRIEDMAFITESGARILTQCPKLPVVG